MHLASSLPGHDELLVKSNTSSLTNSRSSPLTEYYILDFVHFIRLLVVRRKIVRLYFVHTFMSPCTQHRFMTFKPYAN